MARIDLVPFDLVGENCDVEQINKHSFVIRAHAQTFDAFKAMTDLGPLWDAIQDREFESKEIQSALVEIKDKLRSIEIDVAQADVEMKTYQALFDKQAANQALTRHLQRYVSVTACFAFVFATISFAIVLWAKTQ